jgi:hypothetical protein
VLRYVGHFCADLITPYKNMVAGVLTLSKIDDDISTNLGFLLPNFTLYFPAYVYLPFLKMLNKEKRVTEIFIYA